MGGGKFHDLTSILSAETPGSTSTPKNLSESCSDLLDLDDSDSDSDSSDSSCSTSSSDSSSDSGDNIENEVETGDEDVHDQS